MKEGAVGYKLKWKFEEPEHSVEGFTREEIRKDNASGCDAFIFVSIIEDPEGNTSTLVLGRDGRGEEIKDIEDNEIWKAWLMMAHQLSGSKTLSENKKQLCGAVFETVREAINAKHD